MSDWFIAGIVVAVTTILVWVSAHQIIATECRKLGAFYVGETVFECKVKE